MICSDTEKQVPKIKCDTQNSSKVATQNTKNATNTEINNLLRSQETINAQSAQTVLEVSHISRQYKDSERLAVNDISFRIHAGEIICLLGPNGAGKTTTVKMASTMLAPSSGTIRVCGTDIAQNITEARKNIALCLGGERGFFLRSTAESNLRYFMNLAGIDFNKQETLLRQALKYVNLSDVADKRVETFSRGMRQRLHIARALCSDSKLIILDEPTTGLDPHNARDIRALIANLREQGHGLLLTTHAMSEAEELSDYIYVINKGQIIASGTVESLKEKAGINRVSIYSTFSDEYDFSHYEAEVKKIPSVVTVDYVEKAGTYTINVIWSGDVEPDHALIAQSCHCDALQYLGSRPASLEETYMAIISNSEVLSQPDRFSRSHRSSDPEISHETPSSDNSSKESLTH